MVDSLLFQIQYINLDKPDVDICACNRDNCNKAVDLGTRKCHQCSSEEKVFECENPDDEGSEVTCDGYCAIISYSMYQFSSFLWLLNTIAFLTSRVPR